MIPTFKAECAKQAEVRGVEPPSDWCVGRLLEEVRTATMDVRDIVLKTSASLRHHGNKVNTAARQPAAFHAVCQFILNFDLKEC